MSRIDILLATFNGAVFIRQQLDSLANQTHSDWRLLVRDDGSSDDTLKIVRDWAAESGRDVRIIEDGRKGLGASLNFAALMEASDAPYFAFCDQDDVWLPEKLVSLLARVQQVEKECGPNTPVMAFCDLEVVDSAMNHIKPSFWEFSRLRVAEDNQRLSELMVRNVVTGCASLGNAKLRDISLPIPKDARMHDWWLALVASGTGRCVSVRRSLVRYRQHGGNVIGANESDTLSLLRRFARDPGASWRRALTARDQSQLQAKAFARRFSGEIVGKEVEFLREYGDLSQRNWLARKAFVVRHGIGAGNPLFSLALFLAV